jgi:hypothetical protein
VPGNIDPIYTKVGDIQLATLAAGANNTADATSGTKALVFTADATNGGFLREIRAKPAPGTTNTATAVRVWINNGSSDTVAANNILFGDFTFPAFTASTASASPDMAYPMMIALPPGYRVYVTTAQTATATLHFTSIGGKY